MSVFDHKTLTLMILAALVCSGCASAQSRQAREAGRAEHQEMISAVEKVLGTMSGQPIDEQRLRELDREMQSDPETRSAVETIANTVSGQTRIIKYCPIDGERYGPRFDVCPKHHVRLEFLTE